MSRCHGHALTRLNIWCIANSHVLVYPIPGRNDRKRYGPDVRPRSTKVSSNDPTMASSIADVEHFATTFTIQSRQQ
jgi:hypothetical protein